MSRTLKFPDVKREQLARPPLKAMLGQVQFPPVLRLADQAYLAGFQDDLGEAFPDFAVEQQVGVMIGPTGPAADTSQSFRFSSGDKGWSVVLNSTSLTLEASANEYTTYELFREKFQAVWLSALEHLDLTRRTQIGLRYIDHLEGEKNPKQWTQWVRPEVVGIASAPEIADSVVQSVSEVRTILENGVLAFKHGIVQAGPEARWGYLLDFDYFKQEETSELGADELIRHFDLFHEEIYAFFRWCLTETAIEEFRGDR
jgi:uncharacterized protein (TIGR04255 family)